MKNEAQHMTENMSRASGQAIAEHEAERPQAGDRFRCDSCHMEIEVIKGCNCDDTMTHFQCCGAPMSAL